MVERVTLLKKVELECPVNCRTPLIEVANKCQDTEAIMLIIAAYSIGKEDEEKSFYKRCIEILKENLECFELFRINVYHDSIVFTFQSKMVVERLN